MTVISRDRLAETIRQENTEELLAIWVNNDRDQWSDDAFSVISLTLGERGIAVPQQKAFVSTPPRSKWFSESFFTALGAFVLFRVLSMLGFGGFFPYMAIVLLYFVAVKLIRVLRGRNEKTKNP